MKARVLVLSLMLMLVCCAVVSASSMVVVSRTAKVNQSFDVMVVCKPTAFIKGFECRMSFDSKILRANHVSEGRFFGELDVFSSPHMGIINNGNGSVKNIYEVVKGQGNVSGYGVLFMVNFTALMNGSGFVRLSNVGLLNETRYLSVDVEDGVVVVDGVLHEESPQPDSKEQDKEPNGAGDANDDEEVHKNPLSDMTSVIIMFLVSCFVLLAFVKRIVL